MSLRLRVRVCVGEGGSPEINNGGLPMFHTDFTHMVQSVYTCTVRFGQERQVAINLKLHLHPNNNDYFEKNIKGIPHVMIFFILIVQRF